MTGVSEQVSTVTGFVPAAPGVPAAPAIRVVSGRPSDEELAALVAVLAAARGGGDAEPEQAGSRWSAPSTRLRSAYGPSRGGWRASGLPS